jgi:hypothetical protein
LGLLLGWDFCSSAWGEAKLFIEVEDMIKSHNEDRQARTKAESEQKDEVFSSASLAANPMLAAVYCRKEDLCLGVFFRFRLASVKE